MRAILLLCLIYGSIPFIAIGLLSVFPLKVPFVPFLLGAGFLVQIAMDKRAVRGK